MWERRPRVGGCRSSQLNESPDSDSQERRNRRTYGDAVFYFSVDDVDSLGTQLNAAGIVVGDLSPRGRSVLDALQSRPRPD